MRVTNMMISNRNILNVHRNMRTLAQIETQLSTQRSINAPSENPILAARILKFRNNLREAEQHDQNATQGLGWMTRTETSMNGVTRSLQSIRTLLNNGITGELGIDERQSIANQINHLLAQIGTNMNDTHAGRFVFSGFRTNHPPLFQSDTDQSFTIRQNFGFSDIKTVRTVHRTSQTGQPQIIEGVRLISLPFNGIEPGSFRFSLPGGLPSAVTEISRGDDGFFPSGAFSPNPDEVHFIYETGEIILGENVARAMQNSQASIQYTKEGFVAGDLNPLIYFDTVNSDNINVDGILNLTSAQVSSLLNNLTINLEPPHIGSDHPAYPGFDTIEDMHNWVQSLLSNPSIIDNDAAPGLTHRELLEDILNLNVYNLNNEQLSQLGALNTSVAGHELRYEFSVGTRMAVNTLAPSVLTPQLHAELRELVRIINSSTTSNPQMLFDTIRHATRTFDNSDLNIDSILGYTGSDLSNLLGNLNVYDSGTFANAADMRTWVENTINNYTAGTISDADRAQLGQIMSANMAHLSDSQLEDLNIDVSFLSTEEINERVTLQLTQENAAINSALGDRFNTMLGRIDTHIEVHLRQESDLAGRIQRIELIQERLEYDILNLHELLNENEGVNIRVVTAELALAEVALNASLLAGSRIGQLTLADFLR